MTNTRESDIEAILTERFPLLPLMRAAGPIVAVLPDQRSDDDITKKLAAVEALTAELKALPPAELHERAEQSRRQARERAAAHQAAHTAKLAQEAEAAERARFYNRPEAKANFGFWLKLETWTITEAAALLLGRDPRKVNPETLRHELSQPTGLLGMGKPLPRSAFHDDFDRLELILSRADGLVDGRLRPDAAVQRALAFGVNLPAALQSLLPQAEVHAETVAGSGSEGPRRWTPDELAKLRAYRKEHGTKKAAQHFDISEARVRELLPGKPRRPSPFPT